MGTNKRSTNSLAELLEKSKKTAKNIYIPENKQQVVDEKKYCVHILNQAI